VTIFLMGLTASGKSSVGKEIARALDREFVGGSSVLLAHMGEQESATSHTWLGRSGARLERARDLTDVDCRTDASLIEAITKNPEVVTDSWTLPWLTQGLIRGTRVYLTTPLSARTQFAFESRQDKKWTRKALKSFISRKDTVARSRFQRLYGFDVFDTRGFDILFDTTGLTVLESSDALLSLLRSEYEP
jgi:cytidylate kinase